MAQNYISGPNPAAKSKNQLACKKKKKNLNTNASKRKKKKSLKCLLFLFHTNKSFSSIRETKSSPENNLFNDGMKKESEGKIKIAPDQTRTEPDMKVFW